MLTAISEINTFVTKWKKSDETKLKANGNIIALSADKIGTERSNKYSKEKSHGQLMIGIVWIRLLGFN